MRKIHVIINPVSGRDEPILSILSKEFQESDIEWDTSVTKQKGDAEKFARDLIGKVDIVAIYGGDGTVAEASRGLFRSQTPLAIIPGGTANVMAKELLIPTDTTEAVRLLVSNNYTQRSIDMGLLNEIPFMLRVNIGVFADMVKKTDKDLKDTFGQIAYGITAVKQIVNDYPDYNFKVVADGKSFEVQGSAMTITNSGNMGFQGVDMLPDILIDDGAFDLILFKEAGVMALLEIAGNALLNLNSTNYIDRWKVKEVSIDVSPKKSIICDDESMKFEKLNIKVVPKALNIIVPTNVQ